MFLIYGTDAPLYHYPIVTSVMVVINVAIHVLVSATGYDVTPWILAFGDGLHPMQWVTHNFLHIGYLHLIGNMIFLVPFGLVVEGKIGWLRMLVLYLGIGAAQGFTQQVIMLPSDPIDVAEELVELFEDPDQPMDEETRRQLTRQWRQDLLQEGFGSLGASAVIFGLLAVCAVWAPANEFNVYFRWSLLISAPDGGEREWSVLTVCGIFVAKETLMFLIMGMPISSEALHLNGFVVGGMIGLATLYFGLVDCEGFDLISLWTGSKFKARRTIEQERRERQQAIEEAKPKGPPQAVVPVLVQPITAAAPRPQVIRPQVVQTPPFRPTQPPTSSPQPARPAAPIIPVLSDCPLPAFDDGRGSTDPQEQARQQAESLIAQRQFAAALRLLAETRQQHRQFIVSAAAIGRLAEGLIQQNQVQSAISVLTIGCDAYPAYAPRWRMRLATVELTVRHDPISAIKQLQRVDKELLDTKLRAQYLKIAEHARRMAGH
jgi:membrane associated rhomboid family serine protease